MVENYISIDLNDPRLKSISEILSNPSCKKILNLLAEKELTETDIALELKTPLNTIDYNIKKLVQSGLIEKSSHFWSVRGKKMPVYRVSNKKIVISPKKSLSFSAMILSALGTGALAWFLKVRSVAKVAEEEVLLFSQDALSAPGVAKMASDVTTDSINTGFAPWQWFLLGAWVGIILLFTFTLLSERRNKKWKNKLK